MPSEDDYANDTQEAAIMWESVTKRRGYGSPMPKPAAEALVKELNQKYPQIHHWVEDIPSLTFLP